MTSLVVAAHAHGKKVILSVGGSGEASKGFRTLTSDPVKQSRFISELVAYQRSKQIDGIDIDWEYWSYQNEQNKGGNDPVESRRLVTLLKALRGGLSPDILLTVDVFAGNWVGDQYVADIQNHVDYVNLMAYDFTGAWPQSPVGPHSDLKTYKLALDYIIKRGFDPHKVIVGYPAYGIEFIDGKNKSIKHYPYKDIVALANNDIRTLKSGKIGNIYFDTPDLAKQKTRVLIDRQFGGMMLFEITSDHSDEKFSLLHASNQYLNPFRCTDNQVNESASHL